MREVAIIGIGQTPVDEHWDKSLRELATRAILAALRDAHRDRVDGIFVGNMMSGISAARKISATLIADWPDCAALRHSKWRLPAGQAQQRSI